MKSEISLFIFLGALGFLPLFGGPRYEAALLAGLIAPGWTAVAAAFRTRHALWGEGELRGPELHGTAVRASWGHSAAVLLAALTHGLQKGFCEPAQGFTLLLLGPCLGTLLAAQLGVLLVALPGRRPRAIEVILRALAPPVVSALWGLAELYWGPAVYAFDPFVGYFAGPLYDTVRYDWSRLVLFRLGTLASVLALGFLLSGLRLRWGRQGRFERRWSHPRRLALGLLLAGVSIGYASWAPTLGLSTTSSSVRTVLSEQVTVGPCQIAYSKYVRKKAAQTIAQQCAGHVQQIRRFFGLPGQGAAISVLLFEGVEEKWRLIGARSTSIAKPWRRQIYIQHQHFPHPVLGHELAHVVAGELGRGPFRIAGAWGGLLPDPGRIEGFAVAAAPSERGDATEMEWSAAMHRIGRLPSVRSLFTLGFLGESAVRSYTASGAFVMFLHERLGPEILRRWYGGEALTELTDRSWTQLDTAFRKRLESTHVPRSVRLLAEEVFSRPAVWGRRCPHAAERKLAEARRLCSSNPDAAQGAISEMLELDETRIDRRVMLPSCFAGARRLGEARALAQRLSEAPGLSQRAQSRAKSVWADLLWVRGDVESAQGLYRELQDGALPLPERRAIQLKLWAMQQDAETAHRVRRALAVGGDPERPVGPSDLQRWLDRGPHSAVFAYLLGLRLAAEDPSESRRLLERALGLHSPAKQPTIFQEGEEAATEESTGMLPSRELEVEAYRRLLVLACELGDVALVDRAQEVLLERARSGVVRRQARKLAERCLMTQ